MAVVVNGTKGNDNIFVDSGDDIVKGLAGDDRINAGGGNDIITGGKGKNTIIFSNFMDAEAGFGHDVVNLTNGEELTLDCSKNSTFEAEIVGKDVLLTFGEDESIFLKNFASKDVLGAKGSLTLVLSGNKKVDLKEYLYNAEGVGEKSTFTGKWLSETIDASGLDVGFGKNNDKGLTIKANGGDDIVTGSKYADKIYGDKGNDYLVGGLGKDSIYGGDGDDEITAGVDTDDDTWGTDTDGNYVDAGKGDDYIYGSDQNDTLKGGYGNDFVWTMGGNDTVYGGKGHDALVAEAGGSSKLYGEAGNDLIEIKYDGDVAYGGDGDDELHVGYKDIDTSVYGTEIDATIYGGKGNDVISIFTGGATVNGEAGNDVIYGSRTAASDIVFAKGGGNDVYKYMGQADVLVFDKINASSLSFETVTSSRADKYYSYDKEDRWYENPVKEHTDLVITYGKNQSVKIEDYNPETMDNIYVETKDGGKVLLSDMIKSYYGTTKSNKITTDKEIVHALAGNDKVTLTSNGSTVYAGDGKDTVYGSAGEDYILGGNGNDSLLGGAAYDVIEGGEGNDFIDGQEGQSYLMGGAGNDTINGGSEYDYVEGGEGNDVIYGNAGDDYLIGNSGADTIKGGDGNDEVYAFGEGSVIDLGAGDDLSNLYQNTAKTVYGGAGNDTISVEYGKATVTGGTGDDKIWGGYVSDSTYKFAAGDGNDLYRYRGYTTSSGNGTPSFCSDTLVFENISSADMTFAKDGEKLVITYADDSSVALDSYFKDGVDASKWNVYVQTTEGKALLSEMTGLQNLLLKLSVPEGATVGTVGDDEITETTANSMIYGFQGNDTITSSGAESIIVGGEGNDTINTMRYAVDKLVFNNGDGHDVINQNVDTLPQQFATTKTDNISLTGVDKDGFTAAINGKDVVISYNDGKDSVTIKDYLLNADNTRDFVITTKDGETTSLNDVLNAILKSEVSEDATVGTVGADEITETTAESEIYGFYGNDTINTSGAESTIVGGEGDDVINTMRYAVDNFVFNNGDGHDVINQNVDTLPQQFATTKTDNISLTGVDKDGFTAAINGKDVVISYNDGKDSVTIKDYLLNADNTRDFVITTKDGETTSLNDVLNAILKSEVSADATVGTVGADVITETTAKSEIYGFYGNDTINISGAESTIFGGEGDDVITLTKSIAETKVSVKDAEGNDTINLADNKDNVNVVFNIDTEGNMDDDGVRLIADSDVESWKTNFSTIGGIKLTTDTTDIETITTADGYQLTATDINTLKENVASWLTADGRSYSDVEAVLSSGNDTDIAALMAQFENAGWEQQSV